MLDNVYVFSGLFCFDLISLFSLSPQNENDLQFSDGGHFEFLVPIQVYGVLTRVYKYSIVHGDRRD